MDHPARRAFLVDLVDPDDLANAVALNASLFNVSNLIGFMASGFFAGDYRRGLGYVDQCRLLSSPDFSPFGYQGD